MKNPIPIHTHTSFDALDGMISHQQLVDYAIEQKMPGVGISQHGNFEGFTKFYFLCKKHNLNPIIAYEAYFIGKGTDKDNTYHMVIIPKDYEELTNLFELHNTKGIFDNFYRKPRISMAELSKLKNSFILTGCLSSPIFRQTENLKTDKEKMEKGLQIVNFFKKYIGDNLFLEIQPNMLEEQIIFNKMLYQLHKETGVPMILTMDSHYFSRDDAEAQRHMMAAAIRKKVDEMTYFQTSDFFVYQSPEIIKNIDYIPESDIRKSILNTYQICDNVNIEIPVKLRLPTFEGELRFYFN